MEADGGGVMKHGRGPGGRRLRVWARRSQTAAAQSLGPAVPDCSWDGDDTDRCAVTGGL